MKTWEDAKQIIEGVFDGALYVMASDDGKRAVEAYIYDDCLMCDWYVASAFGGVDLDCGTGLYYELAGTTEYPRDRMRLMKSETLTWINNAQFTPDKTPMLEWRDGDWHPRTTPVLRPDITVDWYFDPAAIVIPADRVFGPWKPTCAPHVISRAA